MGAFHRRAASVLALSLLAAGIGNASLFGCSSGEGSDTSKAALAELPPLHFRADTPNLMLTWLDARGESHVTSSPSGIPKEYASFVRVLVSDSQQGASDPLYVSDLSALDADGSYVAKSTRRSEWEAEIERRRKEREDTPSDERPERRTRRDASRTPPSEGPGPQGGQGDDSTDPAPDAAAIVYGATWCSACKQALSHLKSKGVKTAFKNIETDGAARAEMEAKLDKIGGRHGAIPVIDIRGKILVGFSAPDIDRALAQPAGGTLL
ncbi:MAG: NrdH-redoxin [Polyangiaceae bacterium]|nr:NrdH-redoxin [Polyangiaceae bacterium]